MNNVNNTLYIPLYGKAFVKEDDMTPDYLINELSGMEKLMFKKVFGGKMSKKMYRLYEYRGANNENAR